MRLVLATSWLVLLGGPNASAQDAPPATEGPDERTVGDADDAMPGYVRTRVAGERPTGLAVNGTLGYGFTESVAGAPGPHHRTALSLAFSGQPARWLGISLRLDGRGDFHPDDGSGKDKGFVGTGALGIRGAGFVSGGLALGAQATLLTFGGSAPSLDFGALSMELSGLLSYRGAGFSLAAEIGYRYDRSANTVAPAATFRPGDRLSLGVSDFDALLVRVGAGYRANALEIFGEARWDLLLGGGAPSPIESPLHVAAGARYHTSDALQLEVIADVCLSSRPPVSNTEPFVVIDPRFTVRAGINYRFGRATAAEPTVDDEAPDETPDETPPPPATRALTGRVLDENGTPLPDAHVVVIVGEWNGEAFSDAQGHFTVGDIPPGEASLEITATDRTPIEQPLGAGELSLPAGSVTMQTSSGVGVIRGLVRDFEGRPVRAQIRIDPGARVGSAHADGTFETELPPGQYTITVRARGFQTQTNQVQLLEGQVTIHNVDLRSTR